MFVKNFYNMINRVVTGGYPSKNTIINMAGGAGSWGSGLKDYDWIQLNTNSSYNPYLGKMTSPTNSSSGVMFGNGTQEPAFDDYTLSGDIWTTYTGTASVSVATNDNGITLTALYTLTNTGSSDFTISEIGLCGGQMSSNLAGHTLFEHSLLENPITIPAGGVGQVTYTIHISHPMI